MHSPTCQCLRCLSARNEAKRTNKKAKKPL